MKYVIIGTAGHVDHGKTALIKALTGTDTDRLKEEKARGISIDLGFASLPLAGDITAGIVDVPGHERFLKNMLAGTGGIDLVMLVIAADEGVMPQTREHLAMLGLYGVKAGVVAINKCDKGEPEWLDMVEEDIAGLLADTFLATAPRCRVSAVTGAGLGELRQALATVAAQVGARDSEAPFRLWIDREFSVKGYGAVVTGSALGGTVAAGDSLLLYPAGMPVRVRGLEWHGAKVERIYAGQRAAINLGGADDEAPTRGMALSAPGRGMVSAAWDVAADWLADAQAAAGTRVRLHLGTGEWMGRVYYYKDQPATCARLLLEKPLAGGLGDRGIVRLYSPQHLLGGVTLLAPARNSRRMGARRPALAESWARGDWPAIVAALVADHGQPLSFEEILRGAGYAKEAVVRGALAAALAAGSVLRLEEFYLAAEGLAALTRTLTSLVGDYHKAQPDRGGLGREIVRQKLGLKEKAFEILLRNWQEQGVVTASGADIALKAFAESHSDWRQDLLAKAEVALADVGLAGVDQAIIAEKMGLPADKVRAAQDILVRQGALVRVGDILVYRKTIQNIAKVIQQHFVANPTLTVAQLRDLLATSRKIALPLLEYYDLHKYTVRDGDVRRPGPKLRDLSE
jgi:selenocysteine-specific elongation factor